MSRERKFVSNAIVLVTLKHNVKMRKKSATTVDNTVRIIVSDLLFAHRATVTTNLAKKTAQFERLRGV